MTRLQGRVVGSACHTRNCSHLVCVCGTTTFVRIRTRYLVGVLVVTPGGSGDPAAYAAERLCSEGPLELKQMDANPAETSMTSAMACLPTALPRLFFDLVRSNIIVRLVNTIAFL